ncbi:MAG TPA: CDP-archaeol synthase [Bacteroidia bacterium]|jgi:CDP-diacylglycerol--serine O-phosphatidyltransferase|nr:CDP-archaeol synthase [Bacteroidia bacterium]
MTFIHWITPHFFSMMLPLIAGNIIHMLVVRFRFLNSTAVPVSKKLFGNSKTWRGFVILPPATALTSLALQSYTGDETIDCLFLGFLLGLSYLVAELPTSYFKRRLGIREGRSSRRYSFFQLLIDKSDSLVVVIIVYALVKKVLFADASLLFLFSLFIHISISFLLYKLSIKEHV